MNGNKPFLVKYFKQGDNQKIITAIKKKIYFSKDQNITPGYYVGTITEDKETYGVFDAIPLNKLPLSEWINNRVGGVFIRTDRKSRIMRIFLSKAPDNRNGDEEPIYTIELTEEMAIEAWGKDYKKRIMKKRNGIKEIHTSTYTPFEKLKEMKLKT